MRFSETPDGLSDPKRVIVPSYPEDSIAILYEGVFVPSLFSRETDKTNPAKMSSSGLIGNASGQNVISSRSESHDSARQATRLFISISTLQGVFFTGVMLAYISLKNMYRIENETREYPLCFASDLPGRGEWQYDYLAKNDDSYTYGKTPKCISVPIP